VQDIYAKVQLDSGTLDEEGDEIDHIYVESSLKPGRYEIEIADGPGDLYEIKGTKYFLKFQGYYGYAGYGQEGILIVGATAWNSKFIKNED